MNRLSSLATAGGGAGAMAEAGAHDVAENLKRKQQLNLCSLLTTTHILNMATARDLGVAPRRAFFNARGALTNSRRASVARMLEVQTEQLEGRLSDKESAYQFVKETLSP